MGVYKVGDIVKLRDDLEVGKEYGAEKLNEAMNDAIGKKAEIKNCYNDKYYAKFASRYGGYWFITDEMIEGLWEECNQVKKYNDHTLDAWRYAVESKLSEQVSKLKLIDVLNMIAKGELKVGTIVKYDEEIYTFSGENKLERELGFTLLDDIYMNNLNDEVELLEPECNVGADKTIEPTKIEELEYDFFDMCNDASKGWKLFIDKLNEVIRYINKE